MRGLQCESTRVGAIECVYDGDPGLMVLAGESRGRAAHPLHQGVPAISSP